MLAIDIIKIIIPMSIMVVIAGLFAVIIVYLGKKLSVQGNAKAEEIAGLLSGANCGGCGFAGCGAFAKALAEGKAKISDCPSTTAENKKTISLILGVETGSLKETVAVVACNGGQSCKDKYEYLGYGDCKSAELLAGGRKACPVGCMGLGTCVDSCHNFAIEVNNADGVAKTSRDKCISCGLCILSCPKKLIKRIPKSASVYIACSNDCKGKDIKDICKNGCIGCTLCAKTCPEGAITMEKNLPVFDYEKCTGCYKCVEKCPVKSIKIYKSK